MSGPFDPATFVTAAGSVSLGTVLTVGVRIWRVLSKIETRLDQHDMMWSDYCREHNIPLLHRR